MKTWNLIDAQDHLEYIFNSALDHRPQRIRQDFGRGVVVMLSAEDYDRLVRDHLPASLQSASTAGSGDGVESDRETDRPDDRPHDTDLD